ncbi:MAG: NUDIX hydrolase [Lentisphaerae bacterium]|nr:NUDIX hydrolase [Lentisphaerota bacterium]
MNEKTIRSQRVFDGKLLQLAVLEVELADGRRARREIVRHRGAIAVWALAPDGRFVFVRQFRKAIERELLEVVAGTRDADETAEECARREIQEETGYAVKALAPLGAIFTAPGFCSEQIDIFYAELAPGGPARHSLGDGGVIKPDPDEQLEVVLLDETEWKTMMARGAIQDAKTWAAWGLFETRRQTTDSGAEKQTSNAQHSTSNVE